MNKMKKQPDLKTIPALKQACLDYTSAKTPAEFLIEMGKILEDLVNDLPEGSKITEVVIESKYANWAEERESFLVINYERKETLEEYNERLLRDQRYLAQRKQEYLRLKAEFE